MSQELLSALMDGECSDQELDRLLDAIERDETLKRSWDRHWLARDAQTGLSVARPTDGAMPCICADVMARLEAPLPSRVQPMPRRAMRVARYWKPVAGLAAAASVAGLALLVGPALLGPQMDVNAPVVTLPVAPAPGQVLVRAVGEPRPLGDDELQQLLIEHSNALADRGVGGALSYARFAAHSDDGFALRPAVEMPAVETHY